MRQENEISLRHHLYTIGVVLFCVILVLGNGLGMKLFQAPFPRHLALAAGTLIYPLTFLIGDLVTEIYGAALARSMIYLGLAMNGVLWLMSQLFVHLPPALLWQMERPDGSLLLAHDCQQTYATLFSMSNTAILGSLSAYLVGQLVDVAIFNAIRRRFPHRYLWLRTLLSTWFSQALDTLIVGAFVYSWGFGLNRETTLDIIAWSYLYKALCALACTPLFYGGVALARRYQL